MKRKRRSAIWKIEREDLQKLLNESKSLREVLNYFKLSLKLGNGNYNTIWERIKEDNLSLEKLYENKRFVCKKLKINNKFSNDEWFKENTKRSGQKTKIRLLKDFMFDNKCSECGQLSLWNNKILKLQVDHIDGDHYNNKIENLRLLCPNCHSQTETFGNKMVKFRKNENYETESQKQQRIEKNRKFNPTKEELIEIGNELKWNFCVLGRFYSVSDNSVRKRCKRFEINWKQ